MCVCPCVCEGERGEEEGKEEEEREEGEEEGEKRRGRREGGEGKRGGRTGRWGWGDSTKGRERSLIHFLEYRRLYSRHKKFLRSLTKKTGRPGHRLGEEAYTTPQSTTASDLSVRKDPRPGWWPWPLEASSPSYLEEPEGLCGQAPLSLMPVFAPNRALRPQKPSIPYPLPSTGHTAGP